MRDRLIELLKNSSQYITEQDSLVERIADHLLDNGVIVTPCVAMVEQVLKNGKIDIQKNFHYAGKYSVVYVDRSKWKIPLIDITEQFYKDEKALERIQVLKEGDRNEQIQRDY